MGPVHHVWGFSWKMLILQCNKWLIWIYNDFALNFCDLGNLTYWVCCVLAVSVVMCWKSVLLTHWDEMVHERVRLEVFTVVFLQIQDFWHVTLCCVSGPGILKAPHSLDMWGTTPQMTQSHIPEDLNRKHTSMFVSSAQHTECLFKLSLCCEYNDIGTVCCWLL